jgi:secreted trypsin-like serine protease
MQRVLAFLLATAFGFGVAQSEAEAVVWGEPDLANQHPYAVMLATPIPDTELAEFCSGVLLDSTHVLTAAHCVDAGEFTLVFVGLQASLVSYSVLPFDSSHIHPDFVDVGVGPDIAVLDLALPIVGFGAADLPESENVFDTISRGSVEDRLFHVVGYGAQGVSAFSTEEKNPLELFGVRQVGEQILLAINQGVGSADYVQLSSNGGIDGGACSGDSGGPVIPENSHTVVAVNSSGTTANCAGMSVSSRVDIPSVLAFIESHLSD